MKLRNKAYIIIGLAWGFFLALNLFDTLRFSLTYFMTLGGLFALSTAWFMQTFIIKQIDKLNTKSDEFNKKNTDAELANAIENPKEKKEPLAWLAQYSRSADQSNPIFFNETLNKAISHAKRHNQLLAILLLDLRITNTKLSSAYSTNESLAKEIELRLSNTLRTEDLWMKLKNNTFRLLLNDIGKAKFASSVANKIMQAFSQPIKVHNDDITLSTNIGICVYPTEGESLEDLLKNADIALNKAKNAGTDIFQFYTQAMNAEASEYIHIEKSLRKAIINNELALYYQPKFHLKTGRIARLEALIRWIHPEIGAIHPAKFLPVAEETGLIHPIGEWAIREACKTNKQWQDAGYAHIPVALNLSPKQFYHPDIAQIIATALKETGLNPNYLELEITETALMENHASRALSLLTDIKATGVQISIDHFGSGYFSISQLKQFPLTLLKIDQNFIKGVPNNPDDSAITTAIIALAHHLGLEVVAEGVETAEQMQYLSTQNCDMVQGYFLSQPLPAEQIVLQLDKLTEGVLF